MSKPSQNEVSSGDSKEYPGWVVPSQSFDWPPVWPPSRVLSFTLKFVP